jgi:hypothetical protein
MTAKEARKIMRDLDESKWSWFQFFQGVLIGCTILFALMLLEHAWAKASADIAASKAQVRMAGALERIADLEAGRMLLMGPGANADRPRSDFRGPKRGG